MNLSREMNKLANELSEEKQVEILELMEYEYDRFIINYSILEIALKEDLVNLNDDELVEFHGVDSIERLLRVDRKMARVIRTLEKLTGDNVHQEFLNNFRLGMDEPELKYLIDVVMGVLKK